MLANGFRVTKIHIDFKFDHKPYRKTFIDKFVRKYQEAKANVEKGNFKLILNSALGKMCEGVCHSSRCDVVTDQKDCAQIIADLNFRLFLIMDSKMVLLHRKKA